MTSPAYKAINYDDYPDDLAAVLRTANNTINRLSERMANGEITAEEWRLAMERIIIRAHEQAALAGAKLSELTPEIEATINRQIAIQREFLDNFLDDLLAAGEWLPMFNGRAQMYGSSATAAFWHGDIIRQSGKVLPLPAYPTIGSICLSNCKCKWRIKVLNKEQGDYDCYWITSSNERCQTCIERGRQWNPLRIRDNRIV